MPDGGVVITVRNEDILSLYVTKGVYGKKLRLGLDEDPNPNIYVRTLAEYASCRQDDHVFFHCRRRFFYGGRIQGATSHGAFYLNGRRGFLGRRAEAPQVWDESAGDPVEPPALEGIDIAARPPVCQPFLLLFRDWMDLKGSWIDENEFYFALRDHNYLLPTTYRTSTMFSISPGEVELLLNLLIRKSGGALPPNDDTTIEFTSRPTEYDPVTGPNLRGARSKGGFVAAALADPSQLPAKTRPDDDAVGYNVPISPYQPTEVPKADIAYYSNRPIRDGTLPNTLLYLDTNPAGEEMRNRINRQYRWLNSLLGADVHRIKFFALAPEFTARFRESKCNQTTTAFDEIRIPLDGSGL